MTTHPAASPRTRTDAEPAPLEQHLADLIDILPARDNPYPPDDRLDQLAHTMLRAVADNPDIAHAHELHARSTLNRLHWAIASRHAAHRGWLRLLPARNGATLLIPTPTGRIAIGGNRIPTRLETLTNRHGPHAELIADLHDYLKSDIDRWIDDTAGILDAVVVTAGRGIAAIAIHPTCSTRRWAAVFDRAHNVGATTMLLAAWPEHHTTLNDAQHTASLNLAQHPVRLTLTIQTTVLR